MTPQLKQSVIILAVIALCLTGLFDTLYKLTPLPTFEENAASYLADVRERAAYSYAAARTLNATISLLESVDTGVGFVSLKPGQVLEPINDMIEQFSDLVLIALASVGVQEILIAVLGDISWTYLLPLALFPALIAPWSGQWKQKLNTISMTFVVTVIATRLLIPTIALGGQTITDSYLRNDFDQAIQQVETVRKKTNEAVGAVPRATQELPPEITPPSRNNSVFSPAPAQSGESIVLPNWDMVKKLADSEKLLTMLENIPQRIITLITIFTFETLALPLLFALLFIWLGRTFLRVFQ
ncbi:MAG: hypothetical protein HWE34_07670 [Methylocystaceae bacterium]|nr:hypothetical protein [Methylocystaceae bacterium]